MINQIPTKIRHRLSLQKQWLLGIALMFIGTALISALTNVFVGIGILLVVIGNNIERSRAPSTRN